jgi:hypothetical protein
VDGLLLRVGSGTRTHAAAGRNQAAITHSVGMCLPQRGARGSVCAARRAALARVLCARCSCCQLLGWFWPPMHPAAAAMRLTRCRQLATRLCFTRVVARAPTTRRAPILPCLASPRPPHPTWRPWRRSQPWGGCSGCPPPRP